MKYLLLSIIILFLFTFTISAQIINVPDDYPTIQQGINAAFAGDTVLVDTGAYIERINFIGKNIVVASEYLTTLDTNYINQTIIDGDSLGSVVSIIGGEDSTALLCGFTIQNGADSIGGGIRIIGASPRIKSCIIKNNLALYSGGGIYSINSNPEINHCVIKENLAEGDQQITGGGVCFLNSGGLISNSNIVNNNAIGEPSFGGGIGIQQGTTSFHNLKISGNHSVFGGGIGGWPDNSVYSNLEIKQNDANLGAGIFAWGDGKIFNSIIRDNVGPAIEIWGTLYIINCTLIENSRGIYVKAENTVSDAFIYNSIVRNNGVYNLRATGGQYSHAYIHLNSSNIDSSNVEIGEHGHINWIAGNIDQEPLFENQYGSEYYPSNESPCVNAGTPDTIGLHIPALDFAGNQRFFGNRIDIGALENQEIWLSNSNVNKTDHQITIQPNPVSDVLLIDFELEQSGFVSIKLESLNGQISTQILVGRKIKVTTVPLPIAAIYYLVYI